MSTPSFGSDELAQFRRTFFEECTELLADLEERLGALVAYSSDIEGLNAIFRAVHSVKAGAGAFGYTVLVGFAHRFEALLDRLRDGKAELDERTLTALVAAADVFSALVDLARQGETPADDFGADVAEELSALLDGETRLAAAPSAATCVPTQAASEDRTYRIVFRPNAELFRHANEPLYLIRELKTLGSLAIDCDLARLPPFEAFSPEDSYLGWTMTLRSSSSPADIAEVFEFVDDECELVIEDIATAPTEPEVTAPPPLQEVAKAEATDAPSEGKPSEIKTSDTKTTGKTGSISSIRVDLYRVDRLVNMVGELVIAQAMLAQQFIESRKQDDPGALQGFEHLAGLTRELQECVMAIRMQPVKSVFSRMPRLVRDVGHKTGKDVRLEMSGEQTEVDKTVIEELADPLTHMIRNAVDHGIEDAATRLAAGKPAGGVIRLSAQHAGSNILIHVEDDGAGLDRDRLLAKAIDKGIVPASAKLSAEEIDELIFSPGFSTAAAVTDVSGRGVGMDVVRRNVQALGGRVQVMSTPGKGTRFTLVIPLTLAVLDGMVVAVGWEKYILPLTSIVESFRPGRGQIRVVPGGGEVVSIRGEFVRLIHLARVFGVSEAVADPCQGLVVLIELANGSKLGVVVDELIGQQQVVIKSLQDNYDPVPGISGATILGNGRVALIVDIEELTRLYDRSVRIAEATRLPVAANA
ncbi:chemotaxis protein CheA [Pleomorphomonas sp. JP5]|uniref:chemotaxis protein CheA n=1 Tax=Pleomorphomonas sp. JP5 TaxID=2942998 RepID=UPI0020441993|nr:chemotaxis protein CheA [Pleomorphomonas sp. JP5]MCM5557969.1 chemotaxis protein CheA [Pleomorphomonas sp. JP5]